MYTQCVILTYFRNASISSVTQAEGQGQCVGVIGACRCFAPQNLLARNPIIKLFFVVLNVSFSSPDTIHFRPQLPQAVYIINFSNTLPVSGPSSPFCPEHQDQIHLPTDFYHVTLNSNAAPQGLLDKV